MNFKDFAPATAKQWVIPAGIAALCLGVGYFIARS